MKRNGGYLNGNKGFRSDKKLNWFSTSLIGIFGTLATTYLHRNAVSVKSDKSGRCQMTPNTV